MATDARLTAEPREEAGTGPARQLRRQGQIPAVIYGHGQESKNLKVQRQELELLLDRINVENTLVDLEIDGTSRKVLIREVQRHPWKPRILHVDFFNIRVDEKIRVAVPIRFVGNPVGVSEAGGILQQNRHEIEVECLPDEIPEEFELYVGDLDIGDSLHVADLNTGGVRPQEELELTLCVVVPPTVITVDEEEEEEEAALEELEPELIGEERPEEEAVAAPEEGEEEEERPAPESE